MIGSGKGPGAIGQFMLEPDRGHLALIQQRHPIIQRAIGHKHTAHQHRRAALRRRLRHRLQFRRRPRHKAGLEHQIFGRIADQLQFGEHDQIGPRLLGAIPRGEHPGSIAGQIAHGLVQLGERDLERIGHKAGFRSG